jgi:hypothetical protein
VVHCLRDREIERQEGEKTDLLTEGEEESGEVAGRSPEMVAAGGDRRRGGGGVARGNREQRESPGETEKMSLWLGSAGWRHF